MSECPEEEPKFVGLGSAVLVTSTMAAVSSTVALTIATGASWWVVSPIGLLYGAVIFMLDRFLVSQQLNPYRFERDQLPGWWRRDVDPRMEADGSAPGRWPRWRSIGRVPATLLDALPRRAIETIPVVSVSDQP